jgi:hypothetical protein
VLKLIRRTTSDFLAPVQQQALQKRVAAARSLASQATLTGAQKSKRISSQWDAFRAGRTSQGVFDVLWRELREMALDKCAICETPRPDTVEHLEEKSKAPARAFDWDNLLAACGTCNRYRENSGVSATPIDPSGLEPLDHFGWDEYGGFAPAPAHQVAVRNHARMYGLNRFREQRRNRVLTVRALLASLVLEQPQRKDTVDALQVNLSSNSEWLGPVREYLLRPPTENDGLLVEEAIRKLPQLREWVRPWLRPPPWAPARWG